MTPIEVTLAAIALAAHIVSASVATTNLIEAIQEEQAAQETQAVYTFGDADALIDGAEITMEAAYG